MRRATFIIFFSLFTYLAGQSSSYKDSLENVFLHGETNDRLHALEKLVAHSSYWRPDDFHSYNDSLKHYSEKHNWHYGRIMHHYHHAVYQYRHEHNYDIAVDEMARAYRLAELSENQKSLGYISTYLAYYLSTVPPAKMTPKVYQKWYTLTEQITNYKSKANLLTELSKICRKKNDVFDCIHLLNQSMHYYTLANDSLRMGYNLIKLGRVYYEMGLSQDARNYYNRAQDCFEAINFKKGLIYAQYSLGISYFLSDSLDIAIPHYQEACALMEKDSSSNDFHSLISQALGDYYTKKNNLRQALSYYVDAQESASRFENGWILPSVYLGKSQLYILSNQPDSCIKYGLMAYEQAIGDNSNSIKRDATRLLTKAYTQKKQYKKAAEFKAINLDIQEEFFNATLKQQMHRLEIESKLRERNVRRQKRELNQNISSQNSSFKQNLLIGVSIIFALFASGFVILFIRRNERKSTNRKLNTIRNEIELQKIRLKNINSALEEKHEDLLTETDTKKSLIREVHHRVKNNLQVISSLLSLQGHYIEDSFTDEIIWECRNRIKSISLIHEFLSYSENFIDTDIQAYLKSLTSDIVRTYIGMHDDITVNYEIENLKLNIDQAALVGLILNEILTDCLKYSIENETSPELKISLYTNDNLLNFIIQDTGSGINKTNRTADMELINYLVGQLNAELTDACDVTTYVQINWETDRPLSEIKLNQDEMY